MSERHSRTKPSPGVVILVGLILALNAYATSTHAYTMFQAGNMESAALALGLTAAIIGIAYHLITKMWGTS